MELLVALFDAYEFLDYGLMQSTSGKNKNQYPVEVILEVQDILNRIEKLAEKLEERDYPDGYRYSQ